MTKVEGQQILKRKYPLLIIRVIIKLLIMGVNSENIVKIFSNHKEIEIDIDYHFVDLVKRYFFKKNYFNKNYFMETKIEDTQKYNKALKEYLEYGEDNLSEDTLRNLCDKYSINFRILTNGIGIIEREFSEKGLLGIFKYLNVVDGEINISLYQDETLVEKLTENVLRKK
jgi:hypothetical protein